MDLREHQYALAQQPCLAPVCLFFCHETADDSSTVFLPTSARSVSRHTCHSKLLPVLFRGHSLHSLVLSLCDWRTDISPTFILPLKSSKAGQGFIQRIAATLIATCCLVGNLSSPKPEYGDCDDRSSIWMACAWSVDTGCRMVCLVASLGGRWHIGKPVNAAMIGQRGLLVSRYVTPTKKRLHGLCDCGPRKGLSHHSGCRDSTVNSDRFSYDTQLSQQALVDWARLANRHELALAFPVANMIHLEAHYTGRAGPNRPTSYTDSAATPAVHAKTAAHYPFLGTPATYPQLVLRSP